MNSVTLTDRESGLRGFTAVELLMVAVLLGILAATIIPQFAAAEHDARQQAVLQDLHMFRRQIAQYRDHHDGRLPAAGTSSGAQFHDELCLRTTHTGEVIPDGRFGPYLIGELPTNPYTGRSTVLVVPGDLQAHQSSGHGHHGWTYSSTTGEFRANVPATIRDPAGNPVNSL